MTPKQLEREGWNKVPSITVSPGGSQHFYYRRNPETDEREWYLKINGEWVHRTDEQDKALTHYAEFENIVTH